MKYILVATMIIVMYGLVGADDAVVATEAGQICKEMAVLFIKSKGELGWPEEVCK